MTSQAEPTLEEQLDAAYRERAHLIAWLAALHPAVRAPAPDVDEPGWQILYLNVPPAGARVGQTLTSEQGYRISGADADLAHLRWYGNGAGYYKRQSHLPDPTGYLHGVIARRMFGEIPEGYEVDHIDRDPSNNTRWNLRLATPNVQRLNGSRLCVQQRPSGRWRAVRGVNGKQKALGMADTEEGAYALARQYRDDELRKAIAAGEVRSWTTQMSWHIHPRDAELFTDVEQVAADDPRAQWDGHTTDAKYARMRTHTHVVHMNNRLGADNCVVCEGTGRCPGCHTTMRAAETGEEPS